MILFSRDAGLKALDGLVWCLPGARDLASVLSGKCYLGVAGKLYPQLKRSTVRTAGAVKHRGLGVGEEHWSEMQAL